MVWKPGGLNPKQNIERVSGREDFIYRHTGQSETSQLGICAMVHGSAPY